MTHGIGRKKLCGCKEKHCCKMCDRKRGLFYRGKLNRETTRHRDQSDEMVRSSRNAGHAGL